MKNSTNKYIIVDKKDTYVPLYPCAECGKNYSYFKVCPECVERNYGLRMGKVKRNKLKCYSREAALAKMMSIKAYPSIRMKSAVSRYCVENGLSRQTVYRWVKEAREGLKKGF